MRFVVIDTNCLVQINKFTDCAAIANADYIVSEDKHFNVLKDHVFPPLHVLTINEFIADLGVS